MSDDFAKKLNKQFEDFVKGIFGEDTTKKMNEFSAQSIKGIVDFGDKLIEQLKLQDNELVKKSSDGIKDLLKQAGLLKDQTEDEF